MRKVLEKYKLKYQGFDLTVNITGGAGCVPQYELKLLELSNPTKALLNDIKHDLITEVQISAREILDIKVISKLKERFSKKAESLIRERLPRTDIKLMEYLVGNLINEMLGLGDIEFLLSDPNLEEVILNSASEPVRVYHKKYGWMQTNVLVHDEAQIQNYSNIIARRVGRQISTLHPLLDAHLVTGDRANAVLYPISNKGNTITIRKFARDPWTVTDFITNGTCSSEVFALIWLAMQYEMNILISGGTGSGKTSMLGVYMVFMPPNHRIITIEDTRELQLPKYLYWCPLTTRQANPEGKGEVTMLDLLINSLRMRPDRIILGEIRQARDAEVLFEAMHTGHSVYATVHADSISETIQRLVNPPISVPSNLLTAVDLNVVMFRDRRLGMRRVFQVGEFETAEEGGKITVKSNIMYRLSRANDKIISHSDSVKLFEQLSRHTGLSNDELKKDLKTKQMILDWMVKHKIRSMDDVAKIMNKFYLDSADLIKNIKKKVPVNQILRS